MQTITNKILAQARSKIDAMTAEELLAYIDLPMLPWEQRNVNGPMMTIHRYALARLDRLTA